MRYNANGTQWVAKEYVLDMGNTGDLIIPIIRSLSIDYGLDKR